MNMKEYTIALILILVSFCSSSLCDSKNETKHIDIESKKENTTSTPTKVESRFFDLGGVINQLFSGFNQGGAAGENPGFNLPSNSQFYPGVPAQNWYSQVPINQGNGWNSNRQNIQQPSAQNQGLPLDVNFNRQGSINNINQPGQNFNQGSLGRYPANLNGNPINGGWNQNGQGGNLPNSGFQQGQSQLGALQGQGSNINSRPNEYDNQNQYNNYGPIRNGFNNPRNWTPDQGQNLMSQNSNQENGFNNNYFNRPNSQNPPYPNNQGQNFNQKALNNLNRQSQDPSGQLLGNDRSFQKQGAPRNQYEQGTEPNYLDQNNMYKPQVNINNNQVQNLNQQDTKVNINNGISDQPFPGSNSWNNQRNDNLTKENKQTINNGQDLNFNDGAIKFPDDDYSGNNPMVTRIATTRPPQIISSTKRIAIVGKPVSIPTSTVSSDQVAFINK
ncbi:unnamed protein product [Diatraea saccharalis]|uniref:GATA zinc finger domain-containing protein 14-like n=1 Tax=Diatraea saccharalis TaxID=40085 RepID=A0A9N9QY09_9NEOP|nr:unnamed protein product [Diatraea saccharalis]